MRIIQLFICCFIISMFGCSKVDKRTKQTGGSQQHQLSQLRDDFDKEEKSIAYEDVRALLSEAIKFRETNIEKAYELVKNAERKIERSKLRSFELKADVYNVMGTIQERRQLFSKAISAYDKALHYYDSALIIPSDYETRKKINENLAQVQVNNGIAEMHIHDYYHAKIAFDQVAKNENLSSEMRAYAYRMEASVLRKEIAHNKPHVDDIAIIWESYEKAFELDENKYLVTKNMANFLSEQGAYLEADSLYKKLYSQVNFSSPRQQKNEEGDLHFRECKNFIVNYDIHQNKDLLQKTVKQLEKDAHDKYYDSHYLQADIEYLMALGYYHLGKMKAAKDHLKISTTQNVKHVNAEARNALLRSYIETNNHTIEELYHFASVAGEHWKFMIEKRLVTLLKTAGKDAEAEAIINSLWNEHEIRIEHIDVKHPEEVLEGWQNLKPRVYENH